MANAVLVRMLIVAPNGVDTNFDHLQEEMETLLENADYLIKTENIDEYEFEWDDEVKCNNALTTIDECVDELNELL